VEERRWKWEEVEVPYFIWYITRKKVRRGISYGSLVCIIFNREMMKKRRGGRKEIDGKRWK
jgi:hypothetical protein